ncbi:WhiB family transcriptional regulator [Streptomyces pharetrae]|uniref:WhiB family transcriptional regulator n=1 Tax=Streptomyces pharetrae TaxID=291370 RepID=UPI0036572AB4
MTHYTGAVPDTASRPTDWLVKAPCRDDPDAMFPKSYGPDIEYAKGFCRRCSAVDSCLQWALDTGEEHGVWGGLSEGERRQLRRRAIRPINIDEYAGTPRSYAHAGKRTPQQTWEDSIETDGDHILWRGPKTVHHGDTTLTPNRFSFFIARGRLPVGEVQRTCNVLGCVRPAHLADGEERRQQADAEEATARQAVAIPAEPKQPRPKRTLRGVWNTCSRPLGNGHIQWTGAAKVSVNGRMHTPKQISFALDRGRRPQGMILPTCGEPRCVHPAHLADEAERTRCGTRPGYQKHLREGTEPCEPCRRANADADNRLRWTGTTKPIAA